MSDTKPLQINVESILKNKAPNTKVPGFIVSYLRKIVHEKELNDFFREFPNQKNFDFIESTLNHLHIKTTIEGRENLPDTGRFIFAGNHPLGGLDGITTGLVLGRLLDGKVRFLANDLLMNLDPIKELFVPVNKTGSQNRNYAILSEELYKSDLHIITYPAGMCSRKIKGKITDLEWKKSFIAKAVEYQRDVIPVYFEGRNSDFFYNLANLRKFLGIKVNIEMLYLSDELFKQRGGHFIIKIGKPIPWQTFDKSKSQLAWAQWVKDIVYKMA